MKKKPFWPIDKKLITVDGLGNTTDIEVLRVFINVACLAGYEPEIYLKISNFKVRDFSF